MHKMKDLLAVIEKRSILRLHAEGKDKDERLMKEGDLFFHKEKEYSVAIYSYTECYDCKEPYFTGLKACEIIAEQA